MSCLDSDVGDDGNRKLRSCGVDLGSVPFLKGYRRFEASIVAFIDEVRAFPGFEKGRADSGAMKGRLLPPLLSRMNLCFYTQN